MSNNKGPWYLLTGLVIGVVIGILYAWLVQPVQYTNTTPASLQPIFKDRYRSLIALAYLTNSDMVRASARLELLKDEDAYKTLSEQAQRSLAEGLLQEARALGLLAASLAQISPTVDPNSQSSPVVPVTGTQPSLLTGTPVVAVTPPSSGTGDSLPTLFSQSTGTITPGAPFILQSIEPVCDPDLDEALIQVIVQDAAEQPVPGVEIVVNWEGGENHFFTGLIPELGLGYADFSMAEGTIYTLRLARVGEPITGITPTACEEDGAKPYWGSWRLVFSQP
jgi:hypothetical protein